jgi:hypothetical protein
MKRFCFLLLALLLLAAPVVVFAAGSVTVSRYQLSEDGKVLIFKLACTGDSADGSVPDTTITAAAAGSGLAKTYDHMGFYLYEVWTVAGTGTAPDAADITINDALGAELFDEDSVLAASGTTEGTVDKYRTVTSLMTVVTANQDTASATWDVYIKLVR